MTQWAPFNNGLPAIEVTDLGINKTTQEIWIATYGRGMWKSPKHNPIATPSGVGQIPLAMNVVRAVSNPSNGQFSLQADQKAFLNQTATVSIFDMAGRRVWQAVRRFADDRLTIEAGELSRGTYMVDVRTDNGAQARTKIVIFQ
jgi:hypothetical protein